MKFCKDCVHCTPATLSKVQKAQSAPPHTGWLCSVSQFNLVTGDRMNGEQKLCIDMRAGTGPCGNAALLFKARATR